MANPIDGVRHIILQGSNAEKVQQTGQHPAMHNAATAEQIKKESGEKTEKVQKNTEAEFAGVNPDGTGKNDTANHKNQHKDEGSKEPEQTIIKIKNGHIDIKV